MKRKRLGQRVVAMRDWFFPFRCVCSKENCIFVFVICSSLWNSFGPFRQIWIDSMHLIFGFANHKWFWRRSVLCNLRIVQILCSEKLQRSPGLPPFTAHRSIAPRQRSVGNKWTEWTRRHQWLFACRRCTDERAHEIVVVLWFYCGSHIDWISRLTVNTHELNAFSDNYKN